MSDPVAVPAGFFSATVIVVADDDRSCRDLTIHGLQRYGVDLSKVHEASDGVSALELIRSQKPDLILLDGLMPRLSGYKVLEELHRTGEIPGVPIFLISSNDSQSGIGQLARVNWFVLVKPITPRQLGPAIYAKFPKGLPHK